MCQVNTNEFFMSLWHELHLLSKPQLILVNTTITAGVRKFLAYLVRVYMHLLVFFYKLKECVGVPKLTNMGYAQSIVSAWPPWMWCTVW